MEDLNAEIGVYLGIIYFVVEVFRNDETFGDELSEWIRMSQRCGLAEDRSCVDSSGHGAAVAGLPSRVDCQSAGQAAQGLPREEGRQYLRKGMPSVVITK